MSEDSACQRSAGSFANHRNTGRVILKATKNIRNGREIFVSYGSAYRMNKENEIHQTKYTRHV